jgi:hypothetical protein
MLFDFDWVLHPSIGIGQGDFSFSADFGNGPPLQNIGRSLALSDAGTFSIDHSFDRSAAGMTARFLFPEARPAGAPIINGAMAVLPLPSGLLLLLTAVIPLAAGACIQRSPSQ